MTQNMDVLHKDNQQLVHGWHDRVNLQDKYGQFCESFINVLFKIESMWDGHLRPVSTAKHLVEVNNLKCLWFTKGFIVQNQKSAIFKDSKSIKDDCDNHHGTGTNKIGFTHFLGTEERRHFTAL